MNLFSPIQSIPRISPAYQKRLLKMGIKTLQNLFYHFPHRYDDFSQIKTIGQLKLNELATIQGKIAEIKNTRTWRKKMFITEAYIQDNTGMIKVVWFNQPYLVNNLKEGQTVSLSGKVNFDKTLYLSNPAYERISQIANSKSPNANSRTISDKQFAIRDLRHTGRLVPVYPETQGLTSRWLRYIIKALLPKALPQIKDYLPLTIKRNQGFLDLDKALEQIHFPKSKKHAQAARRRLAFDELFLIQLFVLQQKLKWQRQTSPKIAFSEPLIKKFTSQLPFKLTNAQRVAAWEILQDLAKAKPMNRLLEGDVGSGKTVVAAMVALEAAKAGWQVTLMAPTEILAQQHFREITKLLAGFGVTIGLLTGSDAVIANGASSPTAPCNDMIKLTKKDLLEKVSNCQIQILIGTHALIQETVKFRNLSFVIVDEQHRFGVAQRAALIGRALQGEPRAIAQRAIALQKNITQIEDGLSQTVPHLLSMTATPIPRTLALTIYGDLDISLLDEMPKGRQRIITKIVVPANRQKAYDFIRQQVKEGRQIFVICPRIEIANKHESPTNNTNIREIRGTFVDISEIKAVKEEYEKLSKIVFPDLRLAMLHGKLKTKEKDKIMLDFKAGKTDILVSTSVVEVGIDVPNATVMMIEGAERFGLAQLHQFRGRVGRGPHQSYCLLFTESSSRTTNARLKALLTCKNGFELAEKDLQIRGPGEFYGTRQWGLPDLSMASLADVVLVKNVREEAQKLIQKDSELKNYPLLTEKLKEFQTTIHLE